MSIKESGGRVFSCAIVCYMVRLQYYTSVYSCILTSIDSCCLLATLPLCFELYPLFDLCPYNV